MVEKVILFMLIASVTATWDTGILSYYGCTIPNITNTDTVNHIDILNTTLTELPNLYDFPNLMSVDIRDNPMLGCGDILLLKEVMHHLVFTTDCDDYGSWKQNCINYIVGKLWSVGINLISSKFKLKI